MSCSITWSFVGVDKITVLSLPTSIRVLLIERYFLPSFIYETDENILSLGWKARDIITVAIITAFKMRFVIMIAWLSQLGSCFSKYGNPRYGQTLVDVSTCQTVVNGARIL